MAVTTHLVASEHGFDDFAVAGLAKVHRATVGHGIKNGDVFNVYCDGSVKRGGIWKGTLERSLAHFRAANPHYRELAGGALP